MTTPFKFEEASHLMDMLSDLVSKYYQSAVLEVPEDLPQREVAIQTLDGKMVRHKAVNDVRELSALASKLKAAHLYVSVASYMVPDAPRMEEKGWMRADLLFDIDVDHFEGCESEEVLCKDKIVKKDDCEKGKGVSMVSQGCLNRGLEQVRKLIGVMDRYLGVPKELAEVHFSGNRGFHVVYRNTKYDKADSDVRRELVDFIVGNQLNLEAIMCFERGCTLPSPMDPGWRGRIARHIERLSYEEAERAVELERILIDEQVTVDTSRLLRVPGSLHGKTGLMVVKIDPFKEFTITEGLSPFHGKEFIFVSDVDGCLKVFEKRVCLRKGERATFDGAIAVYLALRGLGKIADPPRGLFRRAKKRRLDSGS